MRPILLTLPAFLLAACTTTPQVKPGDLTLDPAKNEHFAIINVIALDSAGKQMHNLPKICLNGNTGKCEEGFGVYTSDDKKLSGTLLYFKTAEPTVKVNAIRVESSYSDDMGQTSIGPGLRSMLVELDGIESPLNITPTSKDYTYYTAKFEADGTSVKVLKADSCPRVDGVYLGTYVIQFQDKGMPAPELAMVDFTAKNLHFKQAALLKYRAQNTFTCYAVANTRPKLKGRGMSVGR